MSETSNPGSCEEDDVEPELSLDALVGPEEDAVGAALSSPPPQAATASATDARIATRADRTRGGYTASTDDVSRQ